MLRMLVSRLHAPPSKYLIDAEKKVNALEFCECKFRYDVWTVEAIHLVSNMLIGPQKLLRKNFIQYFISKKLGLENSGHFCKKGVLLAFGHFIIFLSRFDYWFGF